MGASKKAAKKAAQKAAKKAGKAKVAKLPKKKCCVSTTKCGRCPLRMLKEGTLPPGYTVKKRKLVKIEVAATGKAVEAAKAVKANKAGKKGEKAA